LKKIRSIDVGASFIAASALLVLVSNKIATRVGQQSWVKYSAEFPHDGQIGLSVLSDELLALFWTWLGIFLFLLASKWFYATWKSSKEENNPLEVERK
jgi:hypothetical protein